MDTDYDLIVLGAGPGGYVAAIRAAQLGMKVACVDKRKALGGTCLNVGCIPSKALLDSSELFAQAQKQFKRHGIELGEVQLDLARMMQRKTNVVKKLTDGIAHLFKKHKIAQLQGTAQLTAKNKVTIRNEEGEQQELQGERIIIATGSVPSSLPNVEMDGENVVTSTEALAFEEVPEALVIVGGGYIGLELGSVWARLGSQVTVVEYLERIAPASDFEMSKYLKRSLDKQGFTFHLKTRVESISAANGKVTLQATSGDDDVHLEADKALIAVGRRPCTENLGLETVGVKLNEATGEILVNDDWQTNVTGIYAIGDVIAGPRLAHKAEEEGIACVERMTGKKTHVSYLTIPGVIYTWPEMASVGYTEEQLQERGQDYRVGKFPFMANGRARCMDETEGWVKILADSGTDRLLGAHVLGPRASDLIAECVTVMEFGGSSEDIARVCHAHPTLSEAVREAALAVDKRAIHV